MTYFIKRSIIVFLFLTALIAQAQDSYEQMDKIYGPDPLLFNGRKYTYFLPPGTGGNQFLLSDEFVGGKVRIKGHDFEWASLNYDIYNQQVLLEYTSETGAKNIIEVSKAWLERLSLGSTEFLILPDKEGPKIYQVLGDGPVHILYYWRKDLKLGNSAGAAGYSFSKPVRTSYLYKDGEIRPFRTMGGFVKLFDASGIPEIKNYIQTKNIKLKSASDQEMADLIDYIGKL